MISVQDYLDKKGLPWRRRGDEAIMACPFCGDPTKNFAINLATGNYNCYHLNKCGVRGNFYNFQKALGDRPSASDKPKSFVAVGKKTYKKPTENVPPMEDNQLPVYLYLKGRKFSDETIQHFRIGAKDNYVRLPYYKRGILVNIKSRDITNKKNMRQEEGAELVLFNRDNITDETLIICEGEYDCMALHQYGIEATSTPTGASGMTWVDNEWDYLETFNRILICFDNDPAGKDGAINLAKRIGMWKCFLVNLPLKDANECLQQQVPRQVILDCFNNAIEVNPETIVQPSFYTDRIRHIFEMGSKLFGVPTAWEELTSVIKGWRECEVTVWTGRNGSGKSTILNQHFIDMARKGEKTCIYSGEMAPDRYLRWACVQGLRNYNPDADQIQGFLNWLNGKVYILNISGMIEPPELLSDFEYATRRFGVKQFIVDSLMKVKLDANDEYNQQKDFVSSLCDFSKKFNCHIHLVAHPRKTLTDSDEPGKVDVKGSSHITDLADNVISMFRPTDEMKEKAIAKGRSVSDAQLYVKKNREFGTEGKIHMYFNETTKIFSTDKS